MIEKEKALIAGCVNGEKTAWDTFVQQYSNLVYHTIRKTLSLHHTESRDEVVEDLYQEFFLSIVQDKCKKLSQFRGERGCTLASWLRVVASRITIDFLRKQHAPTFEVDDTLVSEQVDMPDDLVGREEVALLSRALEVLSPRERMIVELSYHQDLAPQEIAAIMKMSIGAVYTQKSRVLDKLREAVK